MNSMTYLTSAHEPLFAGSEEVVDSIPSSSTKKSQWIQTDSLTI